jgi:hypothetical protein
MSGRTDWMIYGANGYTGHLVAVETRRRGLNPVLAGRRAGPIEKLAAELDLPMRVFGLDDAPAAAGAIAWRPRSAMSASWGVWWHSSIARFAQPQTCGNARSSAASRAATRCFGSERQG